MPENDSSAICLNETHEQQLPRTYSTCENDVKQNGMLTVGLVV